MNKNKKKALKKPKTKRRSPVKSKRKIITKNMTFSEILTNNPDAAWILMEKGMHCAGCTMSAGETLEQGAIMHGLDPNELVNELNKKLNKK